MCVGLGTVLGTEVLTNAPLMSIGLDSIAAVEFTNVISEELGMTLPAIMLFDHPTVDSIASYLATELESGDVQAILVMEEAVDDARCSAVEASRKEVLASIVAVCFQVAGSTRSEAALRHLVSRADVTASSIPVARWVAPATGVAASAAYGSFVEIERLAVDFGAFEISALEARSMDPQQSFVLHAGYAVLASGYPNGVDATAVRDGLMCSGAGVFVGVEPSGHVVQESANAFSASGGAASITSGRLSFSLGLVGPCYTIDTACSSALAALHVCTRALLNWECNRSVGVGTKVLS